MLTKIALATALVLGSAPLAVAQNLQNFPTSTGYTSGPVVQVTNPLLSYAKTGQPQRALPDAEKNWLDRASQNVDGGG